MVVQFLTSQVNNSPTASTLSSAVPGLKRRYESNIAELSGNLHEGILFLLDRVHDRPDDRVQFGWKLVHENKGGGHASLDSAEGERGENTVQEQRDPGESHTRDKHAIRGLGPCGESLPGVQLLVLVLHLTHGGHQVTSLGFNSLYVTKES